MRTTCEKCGTPLAPDRDAFICSYECTFFDHCSAELREICPNCGGELVRRPPHSRTRDRDRHAAVRIRAIAKLAVNVLPPAVPRACHGHCTAVEPPRAQGAEGEAP